MPMTKLKNWFEKQQQVGPLPHLPHHLVLLTFAIVYLIIIAFGKSVFWDPDVPWHLAAGDWIRASGTVLAPDPFSFGEPTQYWYNISWSWDVFLSLIVDWFGAERLYLLPALFIAGTAAIIMQHLLWRARFGIMEMVIILSLAVIVLWPEGAVARPQLVSFLAIALAHLLLYRVVSLGERPALLYWLPLITWIWANMHGGFITMYFMIGAYLLQAFLANNRQLICHLLLVGALSGFAAVATPLHLYMVEAIMRTLNSVVTEHIIEWQPFNIHMGIGLTVAVIAFILLSNFQERRIGIGERFLCAFFLIMTLMSARNIFVFVILAVPMMAMALHTLNKKQPNYTAPPTQHRFSSAAPLQKASLFLAVLAIGLSFANPLLYRINPHLLYPAHSMPFDVLNYIGRFQPNARFLNDYTMGGAQIYFSDIPVFVDGRAGTVYSEERLKDALNLTDVKANSFFTLFKKYNAQGIIVQKDETLEQIYDNGGLRDKLVRVFKGDAYTVFMLREPSSATD